MYHRKVGLLYRFKPRKKLRRTCLHEVGDHFCEGQECSVENLTLNREQPGCDRRFL